MGNHPKALAHGKIEKVFDHVFFVKGVAKMPMLLPMKISRSMTVLSDPKTGDLTLVNSMRLNEEGLRELEKLGSIKNVVRLAGFHGRDDGFYREKYAAKIMALFRVSG